jgi:hypothetical protein
MRTDYYFFNMKDDTIIIASPVLKFDLSDYDALITRFSRIVNYNTHIESRDFVSFNVR